MDSRYRMAMSFPENDPDSLMSAAASPAMTAATMLTPVIFKVTRSPFINGPVTKTPSLKLKKKRGT